MQCQNIGQWICNLRFEPHVALYCGFPAVPRWQQICRPGTSLVEFSISCLPMVLRTFSSTGLEGPFKGNWPWGTHRWRTQLIRVESVGEDGNSKGVPREAYIQLHNLIKLKTHKLGLVWRLDSNKNPQSSLFSDYPSFWFYFWRERTAPLFLLLSVCQIFGFFAP